MQESAPSLINREKTNYQLFKSYKNAENEEEKSKIKARIIEQYVDLAHSIAYRNKYLLNNSPLLDEGDLFMFGIEGLNQAIERFNPDNGIKFETYAQQRIRGKIIDELRKVDIVKRIKELPGVVSLDSHQNTNNEDVYALYDVIPSDSKTPLEIAEKDEEMRSVTEFIKKLDKRERMIITLYYFEDLEFKKIAKMLGVTVSRVSQLYHGVLRKLKNILEGTTSFRSKRSVNEDEIKRLIIKSFRNSSHKKAIQIPRINHEA